MSGDTCEIDTVTERPRTPNDQYTCLTDEQLSNIKKDASPFFRCVGDESANTTSANPPPKVGGRYYRDRYTDASYGAAGQPFCWIGDQWCRHPPEEYNSCRARASVRWGPNKSGERIRSHFYGESIDRYTAIDMHRPNPKNIPGPVIMMHGRATEGYYAQKNPTRTTWFGATMPLNRTRILASAPAKTSEQYAAIRAAQQSARLQRSGKWPEFSEYTDAYLLNGIDKTTLPPIERSMTMPVMQSELA